MASFKVKYSTRNKLAKSLQKEIRDLGLIDFGTLYDSIRISAMTGDELNRINVTINAMFYYLFLDEGTERDGVQAIPPYSITDKWLRRGDVKDILAEVTQDYIAWQFKNYPLLDMAKILNNPIVSIKFNWIDSPYPNLKTAPTTAFF
jgi:hypothetical protein